MKAISINSSSLVSLDIEGLTPNEVAQALDNITFDYINLVLAQGVTNGVADDVTTQVYILKTLRDAFKRQSE